MEVNDEVEQAFRQGVEVGKNEARKTAVWRRNVQTEEYFCENCGGTASLAHNHKHIVTSAYCPHCGRIMVGRR